MQKPRTKILRESSHINRRYLLTLVHDGVRCEIFIRYFSVTLSASTLPSLGINRSSQGTDLYPPSIHPLRFWIANKITSAPLQPSVQVGKVNPHTSGEEFYISEKFPWPIGALDGRDRIIRNPRRFHLKNDGGIKIFPALVENKPPQHLPPDRLSRPSPWVTQNLRCKT